MTRKPANPPLAALRHHVSGAIERGESAPIEAQDAQVSGRIADSVGAGARIALAILQEWIAPDDLAKCPGLAATHDYCDSNVALYGAFAAIHFAECDAGQDSDSAWLDAVADRLDSMIRAT
jgi:hypothetical protein